MNLIFIKGFLLCMFVISNMIRRLLRFPQNRGLNSLETRTMTAFHDFSKSYTRFYIYGIEEQRKKKFQINVP